jgi:hypothetical protein
MTVRAGLCDGVHSGYMAESAVSFVLREADLPTKQSRKIL